MIKKIKGTRDYFSTDAKKLEKTISILENISKRYSLNKIISPTFENTDLFSKAVGNETDVVSKEMYTFKDKKGRSISLKPEGTASTVRIVLENKLLDNNKSEDFYYIDSMFRYERPQKGRQREFFQFGVERFGKDSVYIDVETILIAIDILKEMNIDKYELQINSIGSLEDREKYNKALKSYIKDNFNELSDYAKEKFTSGNIFRIFDSKDESDLKILKNVPSIFEFISIESKERFELIEKLLIENKIKYVINNNLVRGLDYYNDIVFEFVSTDLKNLGTKSTIIGGGRYDSLINKFDETKQIPAIGFAVGLERLMLAANDYLEGNVNDEIDYYLIVAYNEELMNHKAFEIAKKLREKQHSVIVDYSTKKISKKFDIAEKRNAKNVIIIGNEITNEIVTIKNIKDGSSKELKIKEI